MASIIAVHMPMNATTHIQKIAPGPPTTSAVATPAMLPVPTRAASEVANAPNEVTPPSVARVDERITANMWPKERIWMNRSLTVK